MLTPHETAFEKIENSQRQVSSNRTSEASMLPRTEIVRAMSKEIEKSIDAEQWKEARQKIRLALRREPDDHWLLTRLGLTYYEERNYNRTLFYETKAIKIAPTCPLVLWDYAGTLSMLDRNKEAIAIYQKLVKRREKGIAYGRCGEGMAQARGLIADCFYRIGICYEEIGQPKMANRYYQQHLVRRGPGCRSIYSIGEIKKRLKVNLRAGA